MLEAVCGHIFLHVVGVEHLAIHGYVNARWFALSGTQGATNIENGVGLEKDSGLQGAGEHDALIGDALQGLRSGQDSCKKFHESTLSL